MATILMDHPAPITPKEDRFTFRLCVIILEIIILSVVGLVGFKYYTMLPTDGPLYVPEILVAIGSTALGALAGLLAPQASREK